MFSYILKRYLGISKDDNNSMESASEATCLDDNFCGGSGAERDLVITTIIMEDPLARALVNTITMLVDISIRELAKTKYFVEDQQAYS